ncbi:MAG: LLM class flavin-dependent oxidoreductase [Chlamydiota bacterium]
MRAGFILPQIGPLGTAENLVKVAQRAEELGYDSLWVTERLLWPVKPQNPYPATPDGSLPPQYKHSLDPLETLTFVAAHTRKIALGTSVLDMPYYNPVMLARRTTTLDVLSGGRLRLGLGLGWSKDEYQAAGAPAKNHGTYAEEFLQVLKAIWTTDPAEFQGTFFTLPKSIIGPKPVQKPHPPIYLAAFAPAALNRLARLADGWNPVGMPLEAMAATMGQIRQMAKDAGRNPASLQLIVRANVYVTPQPSTQNRFIFTGSLEQIKEDVEGCRRIKADEIFFDCVFSPDGNSMDRFLSLMQQLRALV